ncbi:hypothetical protein LIER_42383 [Lithospermum erythrorhizon]|uniref:HAT C-terminal dimerisation domain-containing protein n=1 Tax=Lithospermum erythrorhizon TaxID=34254 RepID=A0AAV3RPA4_LITER
MDGRDWKNKNLSFDIQIGFSCAFLHSVFTATSERAFSAMKNVKTQLRNKMCNDYLTNSLVLCTESEIEDEFNTDSLINDFRDSKERRLLL